MAEILVTYVLPVFCLLVFLWAVGFFHDLARWLGFKP